MKNRRDNHHIQIVLAVIVIFLVMIPPLIYFATQPFCRHYHEASARHLSNLQAIASLGTSQKDPAKLQSAVQELAGKEREISRVSLRDARLTSFVLFLVGGLCTALLTTFLIIRTLVGPLISLCRQIKEIPASGQEVRIDVKGREEFQQITRAFNRHMELLQEKDRQLYQAQQMELAGLLAGGMVHEFNTILTIVRGFAEHLQKKLPSHDPLQKISQHIVNAVNRGSHLTRALRPFQREGLIQPQPVEMNLLVQGVREEHEKMIGNATAIMVEPHREPLWVLGDRHYLQQVLINVINNARDAMPYGGVIRISNVCESVDHSVLQGYDWACAGEFAAISITDCGVGMDEATVGRIFQPFFTTKEVGKGTGLGLTMAFGIIREHKGFISIRSRPDEGTALTIYLPTIARPCEV